MAPHHATKKTTKTLTQTARKAPHRRRKHIVEHVEEIEEDVGGGDDDDDDDIDANGADTEAMDLDDDEHAEPAESQSASTPSHNKLEQLMVDMVDAQRKRHQVRKLGIRKAYSNSHAEAKGAIDTLFDQHEANASRAYEAQLKRLQSLLQNKRTLETLIAEKAECIRINHLNYSRQLQKVAEHKARDLR